MFVWRNLNCKLIQRTSWCYIVIHVMESSNYHNLRKQQMVDRYSRILDEESEIIRIQNSILTNGSSTYARSTLRFPDFCTPSFVLYNLFYMSETNCIYSQVLLLRN